jgi:DNA (cytosine-5)-methyltransferase 1
MTPLVQGDGDARLTFTDVFCGAGGSSIGLSEAGFELRLAANHWDRAIETHSANFRDADHLCADVSNYDWRRAPRTTVAWFSPECTWHSPAGGRKQVRAQLDMFEEYVPDDAGVRSRATAFDVIRATEVHRYWALIVENVVEFAAWEMFDWWLEGLRQVGRGYNVQMVCVSSAHVGDEENPHAPQWRDRLYLVATQKGLPLPDVEPRPLAWCDGCGDVVRARQAWKKPGARRIGKYGWQYVYVCPEPGCASRAVEPFVLPAAAAIDWSDLGVRIGDRPRPLAPSTMRRIETGIELFAQPVLAQAAGQTWERPGSGYVRAWPAFESPAMARTGTGGDGLATAGSFTTPVGGTWRTDVDPLGAAPMGARTTRETDGMVVPPFAVTLNHGKEADGRHQALDDAPLPTRATKIGEGMVVPPGAFIQKHHGGLDYGPIEHMVKGVGEPLPGVVAKPNLSLVIPYRRGQNPRPAGSTALPTVATRESTGVLDAAVAVEDCRFRMLKPSEHLAAQRFPADYVVTGNKGEQTMQAGNAVSANVAHWLGRQLRAVLG